MFAEDYVFEKESFSRELLSGGKYLIIPAPEDNDLIKGIYNKETGIAIFNHSLDKTNPFTEVQKIELEPNFDESKMNLMHRYLREKEETIMRAVKDKLTLAKYYNDGLRKIHDGTIIDDKLSTLKAKLIKDIFQDKIGSGDNIEVDKSYFGLNGAYGPFYHTQFSRDVERCFILNGGGSSCSSQILKQVATVAVNKGFHTKQFYCPFYFDELDCVVIPELKTAIVDSEPPHEVEPLHPKDIVITIDEDYRSLEGVFSNSLELRELEAKYKQFMRQAMMLLHDYRKYKRQELHQSQHYQDLTAKEIIKLLSGE